MYFSLTKTDVFDGGDEVQGPKVATGAKCGFVTKPSETKTKLIRMYKIGISRGLTSISPCSKAASKRYTLQCLLLILLCEMDSWYQETNSASSARLRIEEKNCMLSRHRWTQGPKYLTWFWIQHIVSGRIIDTTWSKRPQKWHTTHSGHMPSISFHYQSSGDARRWTSEQGGWRSQTGVFSCVRGQDYGSLKRKKHYHISS